VIFHVVVMVFMLFSKKGWGEVETDCFFLSFCCFPPWSEVAGLQHIATTFDKYI